MCFWERTKFGQIVQDYMNLSSMTKTALILFLCDSQITILL